MIKNLGTVLLLLSLTGQASANRLAAGQPNGPQDYQKLATENGFIVTATTRIQNFKIAKTANSDVKCFDAINIGPIYYNETDIGHEFGRWSVYEKYYSVKAAIANATEMNLGMGVDWLIRHNGEPVKALPGAVLGNVLDNCPKGVWGWTKGKTLLEAYAYKINSLSKTYLYNYVDGFWLDTGPSLNTTGHPEINKYVPSYKYRWMTPFRHFISLLNTDKKIIVNAYGQSHIWIGLDGPDNTEWVNGYKLENFLNPRGWRRNLPYLERWLTYWDYRRGDRRGAFHVGLKWINDNVGLDYTVLQCAPKIEWTLSKKRKYIRFCLGTFLLSVKPNYNGPYFAANLHFDQTPLDINYYPVIKKWVNLEPDGEVFSTEIYGYTLYCRLLEGKLLIVNPNNVSVYSTPSLSSRLVRLTPYWQRLLNRNKQK